MERKRTVQTKKDTVCILPYFSIVLLKSYVIINIEVMKKFEMGGTHMGIYLNPTNESFQEAVNSEIYVDKTRLITFTNRKIKTSQKHICVSRPRRFGKSMNLGMLAAYYSKGCRSKKISFRGSLFSI